LEKVRSFLSLNIDASIINSLAVIQNRVKEALNEYAVKWEHPDKFHLTLRFLGDLYQNSISELIRHLETVNFDFKTIETFTSGIGFFPDRKFPNVVFIDLTEIGCNLDVLTDNIDKVLSNFGIKPDKKFVPHITIGRFRREKRKKLEGNFNTETERININFDSYYLMKSILTPSGSFYNEIKCFPFNKM
jgi:2'-5' RNA ligase